MISDKFSGRSKGFGFVEMPNDDDALSAIDQLNETKVGGRVVIVKKAHDRERAFAR